MSSSVSGRDDAVWSWVCCGPGTWKATFPCCWAGPCPTPRAVDRVVCLHLPGPAFEQLLLARPAIGRRWLSSVAGRLAGSHDRLIRMLGRSLSAQLAALLLDEAESGVVLLPQRTVAAMLGVARPSLNKVLKDFERRGLVELGYGSVHIRDGAALAGISASG